MGCAETEVESEEEEKEDSHDDRQVHESIKFINIWAAGRTCDSTFQTLEQP